MTERTSQHENVREVRKKNLGGMISLLSLGGFIGETIEKDIASCYSRDVLRAIKPYCSIGSSSFFRFADNVQKAHEKLFRYVDKDNLPRFSSMVNKDLTPEETKEINDERAFGDWALSHIARLEYDRISNLRLRRFSDIDLPGKFRTIFSTFNILDERILILHTGIFGERRHTASEIAALSEFNCNEAYILKILNSLKNDLTYQGFDWSLLDAFREDNQTYR